MKVMLLKDVYNLGRAGEVKRVADGYARNFLIPKKLAVPASAGALRQIEKIQSAAARQRELLNEEMGGVAEQIKALELVFKAKVGETGKLYGSITQQAIIDAVNKQLNTNLDRHQVEAQPLREVGEHAVRIRLTFDLIPEVKVIVESDEEKKEDRAAGRKAAKPAAEAPAVEPEAAVEVEETVEAEESESPAEEEA